MPADPAAGLWARGEESAGAEQGSRLLPLPPGGHRRVPGSPRVLVGLSIPGGRWGCGEGGGELRPLGMARAKGPFIEQEQE